MQTARQQANAAAAAAAVVQQARDAPALALASRRAMNAQSQASRRKMNAQSQASKNMSADTKVDFEKHEFLHAHINVTGTKGEASMVLRKGVLTSEMAKVMRVNEEGALVFRDTIESLMIHWRRRGVYKYATTLQDTPQVSARKHAEERAAEYARQGRFGRWWSSASSLVKAPEEILITRETFHHEVEIAGTVRGYVDEIKFPLHELVRKLFKERVHNNLAFDFLVDHNIWNVTRPKGDQYYEVNERGDDAWTTYIRDRIELNTDKDIIHACNAHMHGCFNLRRGAGFQMSFNLAEDESFSIVDQLSCYFVDVSTPANKVDERDVLYTLHGETPLKLDEYKGSFVRVMRHPYSVYMGAYL